MDFGQIHGWNDTSFYHSNLRFSEIFLNRGMFILLVFLQFRGKSF